MVSVQVSGEFTINAVSYSNLQPAARHFRPFSLLFNVHEFFFRAGPPLPMVSGIILLCTQVFLWNPEEPLFLLPFTILIGHNQGWGAK